MALAFLILFPRRNSTVTADFCQHILFSVIQMEGTRGVGGIECLLSLNISRTRPGSPKPTGFFFVGVGWWDLKLGPGCPCLL